MVSSKYYEELNGNGISYLVYGRLSRDNKQLIINPTYERLDENNLFPDLSNFSVNKNGLIALDLDKINIEDHMEPVKINAKEYLSYLRGDISLQDLTRYLLPNNGFILKENIDFRLADLYSLVSKNTEETIDISNLYSLFKYDLTFKDANSVYDLLKDDIFYKNEKGILMIFISSLRKIILNEGYIYSYDEVKSSIKDELDYLKGLRVNRSRIIMSYFVEEHSQEANYYMFNQYPSLLDTYKDYLDKLILLNDTLAIKAKAYLDYEGAFFWKTNYVEAEELLMRLAKDGDDEAITTLGFLYYYHNPTGFPNYNKAFECFSLGSALHHAEATYKLSDCLLNGYGCDKNFHAAYSILSDLYYEQKKLFINGNHIWKYADCALRMSKMNQDEELEEDPIVKERDSKKYAIIAKTAINYRMNTIDYFGDSDVYKKIMDNYLSQGPFKELESKIEIKTGNELEEFFESFKYIKDELRFELISDELSRTTLRFYLPKNSDSDIEEVFVDFGESCLTKEVTITGFSLFNQNVKGLYKNYNFALITRPEYGNHSALIIRRKENVYFVLIPSINVPDKLLNKGKLHQVACILLDSQKLSEKMPYHFIADDINIKPNDRVIVKLKNITKEATVYKVLNIYESDLEYPIEEYGIILRKVKDDTLVN